MTNIDQFESFFKKADKTPFTLEAVVLDTVMVVTDVDRPRSERLGDQLKVFLHTLESDHPLNWQVVPGDDHAGIDALLTRIDRAKPDLICTYRNLHAPAASYPYSLGVYLDVLAQVTSVPVLVVPSPHRESQIPTHTKTVMAITDHLTGDHHLVSFAAHLAGPNGTLLLTHVEDEVVFERYMSTIAKVPTIDTDDARETILGQLLQEPHDYIRSCAEILHQSGLPITIEEVVTLGHYLKDYQRLVEQHAVDLLVMNTKQEDQMAMHGVAYPLCVELRDTPILML